ncbi:MAG TPA: NAD-dependent protein deacetylase [Thermoanaerobaculia bacterium]|nr:NAD-dependent protein deacetylase [Thermoanaerobaculia bacterium]
MTASPLSAPAGSVAPPAGARLVALLAGARRTMVLTGAGCSTESGIPDYRAADGTWKHRQPMTYQRFVGDEAARRRYWAGSFVGWRRMASAAPNPAHRALARLEAAGRVGVLVTQNVDGLHQRAGSARVVDLHGRLDKVVCLACRTRFAREGFQAELARRNPGLAAVLEPARTRPDGDAGVADAVAERFAVPPCPRCGGVLKPDVVFFGEAVPPGRVTAAFAALEASDCLLVAGSSLMVWSGYRFVRRARELGLPVAAVNLGRTRADDELTLKVEARCGEVLAHLADALA